MFQLRSRYRTCLVLVSLVAWLVGRCASAETFKGKVVAVTDGDTIKGVHGGKAEKVRLSGIDCPEKGQAYGKPAKQFTSSLVFAKVVKVNVSGRDRYGRTLGLVTLQDGRNLSHELVKAGVADIRIWRNISGKCYWR